MATLNIKSFPDDLYEKLQRRAIEEHRSIAQEVTHLLQKLLEVPPSRSILELRGLGKDLWQGIDVDEYIERERAAWD
jgi:plasmid stability protein